MENKKGKIIWKKLIIIGIVLLVSMLFTILDEKPTFADSGFGTSYDSGGSSWSSGGSSWDSGSSWSSSGSSSRRYSNGNSNGDEDAIFGGIVFISIMIAVFIYLVFSRRLNNTNNYTPNAATLFDEATIENQIKQYIPNFNKEEFLNDGYKIYCDVQDAWMNFKLEDVRDIITDELYSMYESQLSTLEVKGEQNIMKDFVLKGSFLKDVTNQNDTITITTGYIIEFYDYIAEQATGKVIRGTSNRKVRITYEMKFRQTLDESKKVTKCPNCGADIEMNTSGICEYCHNKLVTENTKWVLTEKKTMNQEYV